MMDVTGNSHDELRAREFLARPLAVPAFQGPFDCVLVHFVNEHFAQGDKI